MDSFISGVVTLDENTKAPAVVAEENGDKVTLWVFLPTTQIIYVATRGDVPAVGVFVASQ